MKSATAAAILTAVASIFITAWIAMLCVGAAHANDQAVPALGYGATVFLTLAFGAVVGAYGNTSK